MRESWTDDRLDDLSANMNRRFDDVDQRFEKVEGAIKEQGKELRGEIHTLRKDLYGEMVSIHKTIARIGWAGMITLLAAGVGALVSVLF